MALSDLLLDVIGTKTRHGRTSVSDGEGWTALGFRAGRPIGEAEFNAVVDTLVTGRALLKRPSGPNFRLSLPVVPVPETEEDEAEPPALDLPTEKNLMGPLARWL